MSKRASKLVLLLFMFITLSSSSFALGFKIGASVNYYSVEDSVFKDSYGEGNLMYGVFLSLEVTDRFELLAEANYFHEKGKMTLTEEEITFTLRPLIFGVRMRIIGINIVNIYLGGGAGNYSYTENLPDRFEDVSDSTIGYHGEIGLYVNVIPKIYLDFNVRYSIANAKHFNETIKLGGLRAGIGFGFSF